MAKVIIGSSIVESSCRICGNDDLKPYLDLGLMPKPNGFLSSPDDPDPLYHLGVAHCSRCSLSQLTDIISADLMFKDYIYVPSSSQTMRTHFELLARSFQVQGKLVVDIGCNDGTLLSYFKQCGAISVGVDPASNLAELARQKGVDSYESFFDASVVDAILGKYGPAEVITATNVVAHIRGLHDFCSCVKRLLSPNGVLVIEVPYLLDMLHKREFDTIYHEHISYFSIHALKQLFSQHDLHVVEVSPISVHGGSIRVFVKHQPDISPCLQQQLDSEVAAGIFQEDIYADFSSAVKKMKNQAVDYLTSLKTKGKRIVGYGAPAKGNILLNYFGIGEMFDYIVDSIPLKHGLYTPGTHLPVFPESKLMEDMPDYAVLMAWNFKEEIVEKQRQYLEQGGKFIQFIPEFKVIS